MTTTHDFDHKTARGAECFARLAPAMTAKAAKAAARALGVTVRPADVICETRGYDVFPLGYGRGAIWAESPAEAFYLAEAMALELERNTIALDVTPGINARAEVLAARAISAIESADTLGALASLQISRELSANGAHHVVDMSATIAGVTMTARAFIPRRQASGDILNFRLARAALELAAMLAEADAQARAAADAEAMARHEAAQAEAEARTCEGPESDVWAALNAPARDLVKAAPARDLVKAAPAARHEAAAIARRASGRGRWARGAAAALDALADAGADILNPFQEDDADALDSLAYGRAWSGLV